MKILYPLLTTESAEPYAVESFKDGYNSAGGDFDGEGHIVTVVENVGPEDMSNNFIDQYVALGYEMLLYNSQLATEQSTVVEYAKQRGMLFCIPVGSNGHTQISDITKGYGVTCGSGLEEYGNATGYPCTFFDCAEVERAGNEIVDIRQCGTEYTLTKIQRRSSSTIAIKLAGLTTTQQLYDIGIFPYQDDYGGAIHSTVELDFSNVAGSDILLLPSGMKHVEFVGNGYLFVKHTSAIGTIDTGFLDSDFQNATGTVKFGDPNPAKVYIQLRNYSVAFGGTGITLNGISGFANNGNGIHSVNNYDSTSGFGDKIRITHTLGAGSYAGGGSMVFATQSYSTPYIGGKLAYIKNQTNCSWHEVIGRAAITASENYEYSSVNGYGVININASQDSLLDTFISTDITLTLEEVNPGSVRLTWTRIEFAEYYEIYFNEDLLQSITAQRIGISITIPRQWKGKTNKFKVRAITATETGEFSNEEEYRYYKNAGILVTKLAS